MYEAFTSDLILHGPAPSLMRTEMSCSKKPLTGLNLQGFIRVADLQSLTYAAEKAASIAGGETVEQLEVIYSLHVTAEGVTGTST